MSQLPRHVVGSLSARTVCYNDVTINFDITIKPGETLGGKSFLFDIDGLTGTVMGSDCDKEKVFPNPNDKTYYVYDRISSVYIKITKNVLVDDGKKAENKNPKTNVNSNNTTQSAEKSKQYQDDGLEHDCKEDWHRFDLLKISRDNVFGVQVPNLRGNTPPCFNENLKLVSDGNKTLNGLESQIEAAYNSKDCGLLHQLVDDYESECSSQKTYFELQASCIKSSNSSTISSNGNSVSVVDLASSVIDVISNLKPIKRNSDFDPSEDAGWLWVGAGVVKPSNTNESFRNLGISGNLLIPFWAEHFQWAGELDYTHWLPTSNDASAKNLGVQANSITNTKTSGSLSLSLGWGPYLLKKHHAILVIQPTVGMGVFGNYSVTQNGKDYTDDDILSGKNDFTFLYGGYIRFYTNSFGISVGYLTNGTKNVNLVNSYGGQLNGTLKGKVDESMLKLTISYRLF